MQPIIHYVIMIRINVFTKSTQRELEYTEGRQCGESYLESYTNITGFLRAEEIIVSTREDRKRDLSNSRERKM